LVILPGRGLNDYAIQRRKKTRFYTGPSPKSGLQQGGTTPAKRGGKGTFIPRLSIPELVSKGRGAGECKKRVDGLKENGMSGREKREELNLFACKLHHMEKLGERVGKSIRQP